MDPNVQVALVSVLATLITSSAVVLVAIINNRKERGKAASAGVEAGMDEGDILERVLDLIAENKRKEATIDGLRRQNVLLVDEINRLQDRLIDKDEDK